MNIEFRSEGYNHNISQKLYEDLQSHFDGVEFTTIIIPDRPQPEQPIPDMNDAGAVQPRPPYAQPPVWVKSQSDNEMLLGQTFYLQDEALIGRLKKELKIE